MAAVRLALREMGKAGAAEVAGTPASGQPTAPCGPAVSSKRPSTAASGEPGGHLGEPGVELRRRTNLASCAANLGRGLGPYAGPSVGPGWAAERSRLLGDVALPG